MTRSLLTCFLLCLLSTACGSRLSVESPEPTVTDSGPSELHDGGTPDVSWTHDDGLTDPGHPDVGDAASADGGSQNDSGEAGADTALPEVDPCKDQDKLPPAPSSRPAINENPAFIQVYVNNIENLKIASERCAGDWTDLIHYMKTVKPSPDLFLVQQISNRAQLDFLAERMTAALPGRFEGIIAEANPEPMRSPCGPEKALQTNAIIYRTGRFEPVGSKHVWQSWANRNDRCVRNFQARTKNVMVKLHDKIANKDVTVASLHWATSQGGGPDPACAMKNILEADQKMHRNGFDADLLILGGDLNEPDRSSGGSFRPWYRKMNGDRNGSLNYRDVIFRKCDRTSDLQGCLDDNSTVFRGIRIDFLMAKDGNECRARVRRAHTVTFDEGDAAARQVTGSDSGLNYSDHKAVRAELYY